MEVEVTKTVEVIKSKRTLARRKKISPPKRSARLAKLRSRLSKLPEELIQAGFGTLLPPPGAVRLTEKPDEDSKTGGLIGKAKEPLGIYIQRVSVVDNFSQRPPFDHLNDSIYRRLIRDFIDGAAMPESKVAALNREADDHRTTSLDDSNIQFSMIDGLQRLFCYDIAILLVLHREKLLSQGLITQQAWEYFKETVEDTGEANSAVRKLLQRPMRYEIFYNIDLAGLLHYMVTFNTAQRRMSLPVQLEIMQKPLIDELEQHAKVPVFHDIQRMPGMQRPKERFAASDLVLATEAFITNNPQVTAANETEHFLNESQAYLDNIGDIKDVVKTLKRVATEIHPRIMQIYADDPTKRYVLSDIGTFLLGFMAACGYIRTRLNMTSLDGALDRLLEEFTKSPEDPLNLEEYRQSLQGITASRGKAMRRLVYDTFLRFFTGTTMKLEWSDTLRQITGGA
jgi:hypothetical protein